VRYFEAVTELEAMRLFYNEIGYPEGTIDYSCNTDGRIILDERTNLKGALVEFKLVRKTNLEVFKQMKRYIRAYNAKALSLPKYGVYIVTSEQKYTVFNLEAEKIEDAIMIENVDLIINNDKTCSADRYLKDTTTQKGWIDETSIVSYNDLYFSLKGKSRKKKDDFIAELASPTSLNIKPYTWNETGNMERKLLDCLGSSELKKRLGAFFTPDYAVEKSTTYLRNIINSLPNDNYVIVDRCAGTGNLEKFLTDEELSHCILNTINYAELTTLKGLYEGRVRAILPTDETTDSDGCMPAGDALNETFYQTLLPLITNTTIIMLENPPYAEPGTKDNRTLKTISGVNSKMKSNMNGKIAKDFSNQFIWSAFELIKTDYYVVYSPVKYFKSQNLVNKHFIEGTIVNRKDFHATEAGISLMVWKNEDEVVDSWQLENCLIKRIKENGSKNLPDSNTSNIICWLMYSPGQLNYITCSLTTEDIKGKGGNHRALSDSNIKQALPLFAANCYVCKDFTEKEVIMKSGDGGTAYQNDQEFLEDCFLWCCLTDKNKCWSNDSRQNETAISQNSKADQLIDLTADHRLSLKRKWDLVLLNAKACEEYNPEYKYGLAQIISELNLTEETGLITKQGKAETKKKYPTLDEQISSFKEDLKEFYNKYIEPKCFEYELLK
jgi:hypothetical protein